MEKGRKGVFSEAELEQAAAREWRWGEGDGENVSWVSGQMDLEL